jgi:hypothetical protein
MALVFGGWSSAELEGADNATLLHLAEFEIPIIFISCLQFGS